MTTMTAMRLRVHFIHKKQTNKIQSTIEWHIRRNAHPVYALSFHISYYFDEMLIFFSIIFVRFVSGFRYIVFADGSRCASEKKMRNLLLC